MYPSPKLLILLPMSSKFGRQSLYCLAFGHRGTCLPLPLCPALQIHYSFFFQTLTTESSLHFPEHTLSLHLHFCLCCLFMVTSHTRIPTPNLIFCPLGNIFCVCIHACMWGGMCVCECEHMCVQVHMCVHGDVCVCTHVHMCMCI